MVLPYVVDFMKKNHQNKIAKRTYFTKTALKAWGLEPFFQRPDTPIGKRGVMPDEQRQQVVQVP